MKRLLLLATLVAGAALAKPVMWTSTVRTTPIASYVMGNPAAKVKVVEYASYSCPHCAHFSAEGMPALRRNYIARGTVSVEVRNAVRDRYDFAAALLARCGGATRFFADSEALFAAQPTLLARAERIEKANAIPETASDDDKLKLMARGSGMIALMTKRGYAPARLNACLVDKSAQQAVLAMTNEAFDTRHIPGTPAVFVNDVLSGATWADVEPAIKTALAAR